MKAFGLAASAALVALLLAGCGGDNSPSTTPIGSSGSSQTTASGGSSATTTVDSAGDTTTNPSFEGGGSDDFCAFARDLEDSDLADSLSGNDSNLKETFEKVDDAMGEIKDKAPSEIKDDVNKMAAAFQKYGDFLKKYDYDVDKITEAATKDPKVLQEATETFGDPTFVAASERVSAYAAQVCGINTSTTN
jgi:hypothetical protein